MNSNGYKRRAVLIWALLLMCLLALLASIGSFIWYVVTGGAL